MADASVLVEVRDHVALITLNRPESLNAMTAESGALLRSALTRVHTDPEIRVGIVTGAGDRAFSAGADLKEWARPEATGPSGGTVEAILTVEPADETSTIPVAKPLIAAIHGYCLGGGLELALACDIRIATPEASFALPEVRHGFIPGGGGVPRLLRSIPRSAAMELILTGDRCDAETALRWGIVSRVVPREELLPTALAIAGRIAGNAPLAVRAAKELARVSSDLPLDEALRFGGVLRWMVGQTPEAREGPRAFAQDRGGPSGGA